MSKRHDELVALAVRWLRNTNKCALVAAERTEWRSGENPDAIGWMPDGFSILVECKVSREDFLVDQRKPHRIVGGMGRQRWYLTDLGVLRPDMLPDGWGLVERHANGRLYRRVHAANRDAAAAMRVEVPLLVAITRRAYSESVFRGIAARPDDADPEALPPQERSSPTSDKSKE
jgi:hypothetical protein